MKRIALVVLILGFVLYGCDTGNGTNGDEFTASTNDTVSNDVATLGLIGTSVSSSNENVATALIESGKIKITSVSQGSAVITVSAGANNATINVTVSNTGAITIGTIVKFSENGGLSTETEEFLESLGLNTSVPSTAFLASVGLTSAQYSTISVGSVGWTEGSLLIHWVDRTLEQYQALILLLQTAEGGGYTKVDEGVDDEDGFRWTMFGKDGFIATFVYYSQTVVFEGEILALPNYMFLRASGEAGSGGSFEEFLANLNTNTPDIEILENVGLTAEQYTAISDGSVGWDIEDIYLRIFWLDQTWEEYQAFITTLEEDWTKLHEQYLYDGFMHMTGLTKDFEFMANVDFTIQQMGLSHEMHFPVGFMRLLLSANEIP